jgi:RNA polymerase sigma factor (sigma-70 family)
MRPTLPDLAQVLRRLANGCEDAARELVERYSPVIRRVIRRHLDRLARPVLDSMDLTQQVWASFFCRELYAEALRDPDALRSFLCAMGRNKALAASRGQRARKRDRGGVVPLHSPVVDAEHDLRDLHPEPDEEVAQRDLWEVVLRCFDATGRRAMELLRGGCGLREVSARLGVSVRTVGRIVRRARERARRMR